MMIFYRNALKLGIALTLLLTAALAMAGPFGPINALRFPLMAAAIFYALLSASLKRYAWAEQIKRALSSEKFPLILTAVSSFIFVRIKLLEWWGGHI
ncbi:MAG: hypothetical protein EOP11_22440, partial [Proteobacteria bacterium]